MAKQPAVEEQVRRLRERDSGAMAELVEAYTRPLMAGAFAMGLSEVDAEELVQELSRRANERPALDVLVVARRLPEEEHAGLAAPLARHGLARAAVQRAGRAGADLGRDGFEGIDHATIIGPPYVRGHPRSLASPDRFDPHA